MTTTLKDSFTFQEEDARSAERKHLNEFLDEDRPAEKFEIV